MDTYDIYEDSCGTTVVKNTIIEFSVIVYFEISRKTFEYNFCWVVIVLIDIETFKLVIRT